MGIHEKGNVKKEYTEKKIKKTKKVVDSKEKVWYINGATCEKKQEAMISEN